MKLSKNASYPKKLSKNASFVKFEYFVKRYGHLSEILAFLLEALTKYG